MSTQNANPRSLLHPLVRRWRVRGICLVPTEVEMIVEAATADEAMTAALASGWKQHIGGNDGDGASAFDWKPSAEEIQAPNTERSNHLSE